MSTFMIFLFTEDVLFIETILTIEDDFIMKNGEKQRFTCVLRFISTTTDLTRDKLRRSKFPS